MEKVMVIRDWENGGYKQIRVPLTADEKKQRESDAARFFEQQKAKEQAQSDAEAAAVKQAEREAFIDRLMAEEAAK